jgi:hypothetical protein
MFLLPLLVSLATAAPCPWHGNSLDVVVTRRDIDVDGYSARVVGPKARRAFVAVLEDCDASNAAESFEAWRKAHRRANTVEALGGVGLLFSLPIGIVILTSAPRFRDAEEMKLVQFVRELKGQNALDGLPERGIEDLPERTTSDLLEQEAEDDQENEDARAIQFFEEGEEE